MSLGMNGVDPRVEEFATEVGPSGPVAVEGARTHWHVGGSVDQTATLLRAPVGIVEHEPEEMTVTVLAGTSVAELHAHLGESSQRTALGGDNTALGGDGNAFDGDATVGGVIAIGASSIDRLGRGHVRDAVLRIRYVGGDGQLVCAGGGTVKNVSGFDLCRLMVGSIGTLGLFAEVTLRTLPIAPTEAWFAAPGVEPADVWQVASIAESILWDGTTTWVHLCGIDLDIDATLSGLDALGDWSETTPPTPPPHPHSLRPADIGPVDNQAFLAEVGVGTVHAHTRPALKPPSKPVADLNRRIKQRFDPGGRLNPGRDVLGGSP
jgi:FAD/FMN-containing dehydrogenase